MKLIQLFAAACGFFILGGGAAFGQSATGTPTPVSVKHHRTKKIPAPPSLMVTPTPEATKVPSEKKFEVGLYGGVTSFRGANDNASWPTGGLGGFWGGYLMDPRAVLGLRLEYAYFAASAAGFGLTNGTITTLVIGTPDMNVLCVVPSLKFNLNPTEDSPIQPYVLVGTGIMNKSMTTGGYQVGNSSVTFTGYSETVPMVSFALGLPVQLPDDCQIPIMAEIETGFTSGQNTNLVALTLGINRGW